MVDDMKVPCDRDEGGTDKIVELARKNWVTMGWGTCRIPQGARIDKGLKRKTSLHDQSEAVWLKRRRETVSVMVAAMGVDVGRLSVLERALPEVPNSTHR